MVQVFKYRDSMLKVHFSSYSQCPKIAQLSTLDDLKFILSTKESFLIY